MQKINLENYSQVEKLFQQLPYEEAVGVVLSSWRRDNFVTARELAEQLQVHPTTLYAWEAGERELSIPQLRKIITTLKLQPWQIGASRGTPAA